MLPPRFRNGGALRELLYSPLPLFKIEAVCLRVCFEGAANCGWRPRMTSIGGELPGDRLPRSKSGGDGLADRSNPIVFRETAGVGRQLEGLDDICFIEGASSNKLPETECSFVQCRIARPAPGCCYPGGLLVQGSGGVSGMSRRARRRERRCVRRLRRIGPAPAAAPENTVDQRLRRRCADALAGAV